MYLAIVVYSPEADFQLHPIFKSLITVCSLISLFTNYFKVPFFPSPLFVCLFYSQIPHVLYFYVKVPDVRIDLKEVLDKLLTICLAEAIILLAPPFAFLVCSAYTGCLSASLNIYVCCGKNVMYCESKT